MEKNIIITRESVNSQIDKLIAKYPHLVVVLFNDTIVQLHGDILVHRHYKKYVLRQSYTIDIYIPLQSEKLPYVVDTNHYIDPDYHHYYQSGKLCLETDTSILMRFLDGFDLIQWMQEYVETYFFSYEYYKRYGIFPFGERDHGWRGIIQTYQEVLSAKDMVETYKLMTYVKQHPYKGHMLCPCGSNKRIRNCHGTDMLKFYQDKRLKKILLNDIETIMREVKGFEHRYNQQKAER